MPEAKPDSLASPTLKQLTPVLIVDAVEPCIKFWTDRLGFDVNNQVPGDDGKLIFASVQKGGIEIMYQTRASVLSEDPGAAHDLTGHSVAPESTERRCACWRAPLGRSFQERDQYFPSVRCALTRVLDQESGDGDRRRYRLHQELLKATERSARCGWVRCQWRGYHVVTSYLTTYLLTPRTCSVAFRS